MPALRPRPEAIWREETKNKHGEWVCSRTTYDYGQCVLWRECYEAFLNSDGSAPDWLRQRRYVRGWVDWEDDPVP